MAYERESLQDIIDHLKDALALAERVYNSLEEHHNAAIQEGELIDPAHCPNYSKKCLDPNETPCPDCLLSVPFNV